MQIRAEPVDIGTHELHQRRTGQWRLKDTYRGWRGMLGKLAETVTGDQMLTALVILLLIGYFAYKEWPEFKQRVSRGAVRAQEQSAEDKSVAARLVSIEGRLDSLDDKLARDYDRLNGLEKEKARTRRVLEDSLEEREIIMRALLGALGGLQELGANGQTKKAVAEINDYLNQKAHSDIKED